MKKLILITILFFLCIQVYSQARIYKSYAIAFRFYNYQLDDWDEWGEWTEQYVHIVVDPDEEKIKVFSSANKIMIVTRTDDVSYRKDHNLLKFHCIDQDGRYCHVDLVKYHTGEMQIYIRYADMQIGYEMSKI